MDLHYWLAVGLVVLILMAVSFLFVLGWAWRFPQMVYVIGSAVADRWTSRLRANEYMPVPDPQDEDYLETRSYA